MRSQATSEAQRIYARVEYQKVGRVRFLGHLDVARAFDRVVRRAGLPVAYTEGFHPRAKIAFAHPLPVGVAGRGELCAIELVEPQSPLQVGKRLSTELPPGLDLVSAQVLPRGKRSPFAGLSQADYLVALDPREIDADELGQALSRFVATASIPVERQTKSRLRSVDIRPGTVELSMAGNGKLEIQMGLSLRAENLVKPAEVLAAVARMMARDSLPVEQVTRIGLH